MIKDVSIEIIQKCLNECIHCSSCSSNGCTAMLPTDTIKNIVDGLSLLGAERICLSGGEPILHPDITEIVKYIVTKNIFVDIYSCGIVGSKGAESSISYEKICELKAVGLRSLIFNLPSTNEREYNLITNSTEHFNIVKDSIRNAVRGGICVEIHFVPMKLNMGRIKEIVSFAENNGVKRVNFLKLVLHGRALENKNKILLNEAENINVCAELRALEADGKKIRIGLPLSIYGGTPPCHAVREKIYIRFDGSVFGCEAFKYVKLYDESGSVLLPQNIYDKNIVDIYTGSKYLKRSLELIAKYENQNIGCENCPVQKYMKEVGVIYEL